MTSTIDHTEAAVTGLPYSTELPAPTNPLAVARALLGHALIAGHMPIRHWRGDFYRHTGTHWETMQPDEVETWLWQATEHATYTTIKRGEPVTCMWSPTSKKIKDVQRALSHGAVPHNGEADKCVALTNGVLDIDTGKLLPHTPKRFNLNCLPFAYDENAQCPQWLAFLESVLPGDKEAHQLLAEWFGYVISGDVSQHKMLSLVGQSRSGKGTIGRTLEALLGEDACAAPTINQMGNTFGRENLIGKSLAVMGDVRWNGPHVTEAVPHLLGISGNDSVDVDRKNRTAWHGKLGVRFMMMSNDMPTFRDASMALAGRMMHIRFDVSFKGREDVTLEGRLMKELPGILNWALAGLRSLRARGYFLPPASGLEMAREVERASSPYSAFLEDCCEIDEKAEENTADLLQAYHRWARAEGRTQDQQTAASLSRGLRTASTHIRAGKRVRLPSGAFTTMLHGVRVTALPGVPTGTWLVGAPDEPPRREDPALWE